ncbi:MAG: GDSL-type esterase/lipase family protein [Verrucomicrobiota bacterium]
MRALLAVLLTGMAPCVLAEPSFLIDFGPNDTINGVISPAAGMVVSPGNGSTGMADANGNYWNNAVATQTSPAGGFTPAALSGLVTTGNIPTKIGVTFSSGWKANGIMNGGLLAPDASLLGEFAIRSATEDYFFVESGGGTSGTATVTFMNLNPARAYDLALFGTRNTPSIRGTQYAVVDGKSVGRSVTLQTSGSGSGSIGYPEGNDDTVATLTGMAPDAQGRLTLTVARATANNNTFGYLGALKLTEGPSIAPVALTDPVERWVAQDALDPETPGALLFVGSSTIRRWESLTRSFADYRVIQRGFGGSQFSELNPIVDKIVLPYQPSAIVVWEGTNDIRVGHKTGETVFADFKAFIGNLRARMPEVPVCYLGIVPCPSFFNNSTDDPSRRTANTLIANYCASDPALHLHYIDTASFFENLHDAGTPQSIAAWNSYFVDDTHLNRAGYAEFLKVVRPVIESLVAPNKSIATGAGGFGNGDRLLFDFGPSDGTNGDQTAASDSNGNWWNNWHATNGGGGITSGEHLANLVKSNGAATGIRMTITGGFLCNGKSAAGGLFNPNPALLGELALETATEDFFYSSADDKSNATSDDVPGGFMLAGLNPALSYEFRFFGSRNHTETRVTEYAVHGANQKTAILKTSGTGIGHAGGNANDDDVAIVSGVRPDAFGQVFVDLTLLQGSFAYLNAMEVVVSNSSAGLSSWRKGYFTPAQLGNPALESTLWGDHADPDGDGCSNLLEYAKGGNPLLIEEGFNMAEVARSSGSLALTYQRNLTAPDLDYRVESSEDLLNWLPVADVPLSSARGFETRSASALVVGFERRFLRLKVTLSKQAAP